MTPENGPTPRRAAPADPASPVPVVSNEPRPMTFGEHAVAFVKELFGVVIGAIIVASLLRAFVGQMFVIPSPSMEPALVRDDRVLVEKLSGIERGDVVVFKDPGGWLSGPPPAERGEFGQLLEFIGVLPDASTEHLIKRVIGLPGDHIVCCDTDGRITVNGQPLDESGYLNAEGGTVPRPSSIDFDVVVPTERIFVLGDNRAHSRDSRCHLNDQKAGTTRGENAFVSTELVVGHAVAVLWPLGRTHTLPVPATFDTIPAGVEPTPGSPQIDAGPEATC